MGTAAVISLAEFRQRRARAEARQELHKRFDRWLDAVEEQVPKEPTLEQVTQVVFEMRQELTGMITEVLVGQAHAEALEQQTMPCPHCGRMLHARGSPNRTVETMVGAVSLSRPYFYCVRCQEGFYPLDDALRLSERRKQWDMQKAAASLAAEVPYETASGLFNELTGLSFSDHIAHEVVGELTKGLTVLSVSPTAEEIAQRVAQVAEGRTWRPILVLAIDGADVPTRPETAKGRRPGRKRKRAKRARWKGQWREAKGFRFYLVEGERIVHLLSWHQVQSDKELAEALRQVKEAGLIPEEKVRLCVIADGAKWIWKFVKALFPLAVQVLDYYHCSEHLHKVASVQFGDNPEKQTEWMEATVARLFCGEVQGVIGDLQRMKARDAQAAEEIRKLIGYLTNNQGRVDYGFARKGGYPIGSGGIESAHKFIGHVRLKRSGAWWYVERANQMLALRCAKYNGTFDRVFEDYEQRAIVRNT
ncbi:MAG TPA: ISKra4 family transposase [Chloroflexi bacterium]|nr:ISKra4 family transposase [Chloroflexota bacterium]